jgi:hypothetical protein
MPTPPEPSRSPLAALGVIPMFSTGPTDQPLPTVEPETTSAEPSPSASPPGPAGRKSAPDRATPQRATGTTSDPDVGPRWESGGDSLKVAIFVGGLFIAATAGMHWLASRKGMQVRQPTPKQRDGFAEPVARILTRHLPLQKLDDDFLDGAEAVTALHDYVTGGPVPLVTRAGKPQIDNPNPTDQEK